jgi:hypothetical protein
MPEPDEEVADAENGGEPVTPQSGPRWTALFCTGLGYGIFASIVGGTVVGLVVQIVSSAVSFIVPDPDMYVPHRNLSGIPIGALLAYPLGVAWGLRSAGTRLGRRGRFWSALGGAYIGLLLVLLIGPGACWLIDKQSLPRVFFIAALVCPLVSLIGGLVSYHLSGRRLWRHVTVYLLLTLAAATALLLIRVRVDSRKPPALPAFLHYPGGTLKGYATLTGAEAGDWFNFATGDPAVSVVDFYSKALAGWVNSPTRKKETEKLFRSSYVTVLAYDSPDGQQSVTIRVYAYGSGWTIFVLLYSQRR